MKLREIEDFGTWDRVDKAADVLMRSNAILSGSIDALAKLDNSEHDTAIPLLRSATRFNRSLVILVRHRQLREALIIGRGTFEAILNGTFLLLSEEEESRRAITHAKQKTYRYLARHFELKSADFSFGVPPDVELSLPQELTEAIEEFTSKRGNEITSWTNETISNRIEKIETSLHVAQGDIFRLYYDTLYPLASELIHGTLFFYLYWDAGIHLPKESRNEDGISEFQYGLTIQNLICLTTLQIAPILQISRLTSDLSYFEAAKSLELEMHEIAGIEELD